MQVTKKIIIALIVILFSNFTYQTMTKKNELKVGDSVPEFTLFDQDNNKFNSEKYIGKNAMVIYFYPKDDTPGCTKEACSFRDEFEDFKDLNALVIGISSDSVESHKKFAQKYNLPFTLLADTKKEVRKLFGVPKAFLGIIPGRVTYVIDKKGTIQYIFNNLTNAKQHITEAKRILNTF